MTAAEGAPNQSCSEPPACSDGSAWYTAGAWLEDAAIPSRVIDELMGHTGGRRGGGTGGSPMGRVYRETTPAMLTRVTAALDERISRAMGVAGSPLRHTEGSAGAQAG